MEPRPLKELLQLLLDEGNSRFVISNYEGLCYFIAYLYRLGLFSVEECRILNGFIRENRPGRKSEHFDESMSNWSFYWKIYEWPPRKRWLEDQIKNVAIN
jgi:hypothetical protein